MNTGRIIRQTVDDILSQRNPHAVQAHHHKRLLVLSALQTNPHGLTLGQIAAMTGLDRYRCVPDIIAREHGYSIYIDHWTKVRGRWMPVYALCDCPPDCPKP